MTYVWVLLATICVEGGGCHMHNDVLVFDRPNVCQAAGSEVNTLNKEFSQMIPKKRIDFICAKKQVKSKVD